MSHLNVNRRHTDALTPDAELHLTFDLRQRSRLRATLSDGREVGIVLPRGQSLRDGDLLEADDGTVIAVRALAEVVSQVRCTDLLLLGRAAYHLGNRHMPVQILPGELRYHHDHVLDEMLAQLGLTPQLAHLPFEPESGAYGTGHSFASHPHYHGGSHGHRQSHEQSPVVSEPALATSPETSPFRTGTIHTNWETAPSESKT